ncbi:hypothetical protein ONE56_16755 [Vibrio mytili]|uniref:hypothetical protein n=1 Tax=Vibrio mytili TaxID=50718 RepID=UPI003C6FEFBB
MTAFGIVSILLSVLGVMTPILGFLLSALSGFFSILAFRRTDPLANAALIINILNLTVLSPHTVLVMIQPTPFLGIDSKFLFIYIVSLLIQFVGIALWYFNHRNAKV